MFKRLLPLLVLVLAAGCAGKSINISKGSPDQSLEQCHKLSKKKKYEEAVECLEIFKSRFAGSGMAAEAELSIGDNFFRQKDYLLAAESYEGFLRSHPLHSKADYALYRLGGSYLHAGPKAIDRDQEYLDDSIKAYRNVLRLYPNSSLRNAAESELSEALTKVGKRNYYIGKFYYRTGEYRAAIPRLITVVREFPDLKKVPNAYYQLVVSLASLEIYEEARAAFTEMQVRFPEHSLTKKAEKKLRRLVKKGEKTDRVAPAVPNEKEKEKEKESSS